MAKNTENEEYQFKEEGEYIGEDNLEPLTPEPRNVEPPRTAKSALISSLPFKNKKLVIIIGIIVFIFIIMQVVRLFSSGSKEKIQEQPSALESSQRTNVQTASINALNEKYLAETSKIQQLQTDMESTKNNIAAMSKAIYDLDTVVKQLAVEVQTLVAERDALMSTMQGKKTPYHIRAIVPGRAWLETNSGTNTTVRIGSNLGKYGNVTEIDDQDGVIVTNKGAVIRYGKNDL